MNESALTDFDPDAVFVSAATVSRWKKAVVFGFVGMRIYPGTPLYRFAKSRGEISAETNLLEPVFYISRDIDKKTFNRNGVTGAPGELASSRQKLSRERKSIHQAAGTWG
jgi:hypothetical protein